IGSPGIITLSPAVTVDAASASIAAHFGGATIAIHPLLTFYSRSPDRFWTVFASNTDREGPPRTLAGMSRDTNTLSLDYRDDDRSRLSVTALPQALRIEAVSRLPSEVYSHLNSFCELGLAGVEKPALSFSPCPKLIDVKPMDYPAGRPLRLAYVDAQGG